MATRYERVILDLEDRLSPGMAKAAASTALLNRELGALSHDSVRTRRSVSDIDGPVENLGRSSKNSSREVDELSGRMRILADVALILGPSLVPIGAVGVPAVTGLAAQLGFAAGAAGTAVLAFQGVGNAIKTLNTAALTPTTANLEKAQVALEGLSPAAQDFVAQVGTMIPELRQLRDIAAQGSFPGVTDGLRSMETALPHVQAVVAAVSEALGSIASDAGASLASAKWTDFLDFFTQNAPQALAEMAQAAGNTAHALAALWMATDPLNDNFSRWLVTATGDLDRWASGLSKTQGFSDFIAYVDQTGPKVAAAFGSIANAALKIVEAAAPLGGPVLDGVKVLADAVAAIADSDLGTPIFTAAAALALLNRTLAVTSSLQGKTFGGPAVVALRQSRTGIQGMTADYRVLRAEQERTRAVSQNMVPVPLFRKGSEEAKRLTGNLKNIGKGAAAVAGLGIAATGAADGLGLSNTASLALMGTMAGPWGAAIGGGVGLTLDLMHANDGLEASITRLDSSVRNADFSGMDAQIAHLKSQVYDLTHTTGVGDFFSDQFSKIGDALRHPLDFRPGDERVSRAKEAIANAETARTAALAAAKTELLGQGFEATAAGAQHAAQSTREFQASLAKLNEELTGRANMRDYQASLDDFTKSVKDNGKTLDINTEKGRNNQAALDGIASTALKVAETLTGSQRATFLDAARGSFIKAAEAAGMTKKAARRLANEVLGLKNVKGEPKIVIDANGAWRVLNDIQQRLNQFHDKTIRLTVLSNLSHAAAVKAQLPSLTPADGATVPGPRHPYGDKVLAMLAPGEEVVSNRHGQADRWRPFLKAINENRLADGGTVGGLSTYSRSHPNETPREELKRFKKALEESTKAIQTETSKRDDLVQARDSLTSTVSGAFTSDIFASKLTGGNHLTQDPLNALRSDIAKANDFRASLGTLSAKGLSGQAFQALAETGDVKRAQAFAAMSPADIAQFQSLFDQRQNAASAVGSYAGNQVYAAKIDTSNQHLAALNTKATQLEHEIKVLQKIVDKSGKGSKIVVNDKSGNPKHTAKEVSRRQKWAGKR